MLQRFVVREVSFSSCCRRRRYHRIVSNFFALENALLCLLRLNTFLFCSRYFRLSSAIHVSSIASKIASYTAKLCHELHHRVKLRCCAGCFFSRFVFLIVVRFSMGDAFLRFPIQFGFCSQTRRESSCFEAKLSHFTMLSHTNTLLFKRHAIEVFFPSRNIFAESTIDTIETVEIELCAKLNGFFSLSSGMPRMHTKDLVVMLLRLLLLWHCSFWWNVSWFFLFKSWIEFECHVQDSKSKVYLMR